MNCKHDVSVSQYVRLERKAQELGKTVSEYVSFLLAKRVGTTQSEVRSNESVPALSFSA